MIKKCCNTCEFCMGEGVCASGYNKDTGKEPYYGERCYSDEVYEKFKTLKEGEEFSVEDNSLLSDKFPEGCPFWEISMAEILEMEDDNEVEEYLPGYLETKYEMEREEKRARRKIDKIIKESGKNNNEFKA